MGQHNQDTEHHIVSNTKLADKKSNPFTQKVKRGSLVVATLPLRLVMPRGVGYRTRGFKKKDETEVCPKCLSANLEFKNEAWGCPSCNFRVTANTDDIDALRQYIRVNGHKLNRQLDNDAVHSIIMKRVFAARVVALMAWMVFIVDMLFLIQGHFLLFIATLSLLVFLLLIVASYGYRAWQLATGNLYPVDGKAQFKQYALNNLWIKNPLTN